MVSISELLIECADALTPAGLDNNKGQHLKYLRQAINSKEISQELIPLLRRIIDVFEKHANWDKLQVAMMVLDKSVSFEEENEILEQISAALHDMEAPQYVYHGTVYANLESIYQKGLIPGHSPVWKKVTGQDVRCYSDSAVFFTRGWRQAANWASVARQHSRGPKNSKGRQPVVLRLPAMDIQLLDDHVAAAPDCLKVTSTVPCDEGEVFIAPLEGFPVWKPLKEVVDSA